MGSQPVGHNIGGKSNAKKKKEGKHYSRGKNENIKVTIKGNKKFNLIRACPLD